MLLLAVTEITGTAFDVGNRSFEGTEDTGTQSSFTKHNKTFHIPETSSLTAKTLQEPQSPK